MKKSILFATLCCTAMFFVACEKSEPQNNEQNQTEELENKNDSINTSDDKDDITISGTIDGHNYVDLGLPSGTKWATCNMGATKPEEFGNYYAWGETEAKGTFKWSTYKYGSSYNTLTKYGTESYYGIESYCGRVDNKTTLEAADDVATQNWGGNWRMPTIDEWQELIDNCTWTWTTKNSVNGYEVKATNGNSIFLPAAGWHGGSSGELLAEGWNGDYWSSSLDTYYPGNARHVDFSSDDHDTSCADRACGFSVRPVCK